ncbi:MAG: hypothetical protein AAF362_03590 [Pseudomonadota bacterium]
MRGVALQISALMLSCLLLAGCWNDSWSWNQKLTVKVETPDGPVQGAAVNQVTWGEVNSVHNYPASYQGEAVVVDLGNGRYLFALIGEPTKFLAFETFNGGPGIGEEVFAEMAQFRGTNPVPPEHYPLLVTFTDINDPKTVKKVDPNNLAATFGSGFALESIMLEITDEPVTKGGVEEVLGENFFRVWAKLNNEALSRAGISDPYFKTFMSTLNRTEFIRRQK